MMLVCLTRTTGGKGTHMAKHTQIARHCRWTTYALYFLLAGALNQALPAAATVDQVIVVFKQHYDIGYTKLASEVLEYYRTEMMDKALATCAETDKLPPEQRFVWTMPGWPMWYMLGEQQTPERRAAILERVKEGRFITHALPFTTHTESLDLEDLVQGLQYAADVCRGADLPLPRDAKMTDVPSHSWVLPTLLRNAGVTFLHIGGNSACPGPRVPLLFLWEGPDGSRLLTMSNVGYGTGLVPPEGWPHKTWLALIHTGDNQGPPTVKDVEALLAQAKEKLPGVTVRMGRLSDFGDAILAENPDLPVVRGDMPDTWIHGVASLPQATAAAHRARPEMQALMTLQELANGANLELPSVGMALPALREKSLLFGEHTWGYDIGHFGRRLYDERWLRARASGRYERLEQSWADHAGYALDMARDAEAVLGADLTAVAAAVQVDGPRVVLFNPLPWPRTDVVAAPADSTPVFGENAGRVDTGVVPAMGYETVLPGQVASRATVCRADADAGVLENAGYALRIDAKRGGIVSLVDKATGREWVDTASEYSVGQYMHEKFSVEDGDAYLASYPLMHESWVMKDFGKEDLPDAPHENASPGFVSCTASTDAASASLELKTAAGPGQVTLRITLYETLPAIDVTWSMNAKSPTPWPEAGWLCFPFAVPDAQFRLGRLGAMVDPAKDLVPGTNRDVFCLNTGVRVIAPDGASAALCPFDSPLVSLERPGIWKYTPDFVPHKGAVFVNLFNNIWSTNFAQWIEGDLTSQVRLWLQTPEEGDAPFIKRCWEARMPVRAAFAGGSGGVLPPERETLRISRDGVLVTAFGAHPHGEGTLLTLWEQAGQSGPCEVQFGEACQFRSAQPVNLRGEPCGPPLSVKDHTLSVGLGAYAPLSVILDR